MERFEEVLKALVAEEEERATRESMVYELSDRQDVGQLVNWDLVMYLLKRQASHGRQRAKPREVWDGLGHSS